MHMVAHDVVPHALVFLFMSAGLLLHLAPLAVAGRAATWSGTARSTGSSAGGGLFDAWFVDPLTIKVVSNRREPFPGTSMKVVDLAAQRGECERAQLWGWSDADELANVRVAFNDMRSGTDGILHSDAWEYMQQLYVFANTTDRYTCNYNILTDTWNSTTMSDDGAPWAEGHFTNYHWHRWPDCAAGWYPDPLMPINESIGIPLIPKGFTQPIFLEVCVPPETQAGNYTGTLTVSSGAGGSGGGGGASMSVPIQLEVWDIVIPSVADPAAFTTIFNWGGPGWEWHLDMWYPDKTYREIWDAWMPFLAKHRIPADDPYAGNPTVTIQELTTRAQYGVKLMNLRNIGVPELVWNDTGNHLIENKSLVADTLQQVSGRCPPVACLWSLHLPRTCRG